MGFRAAASAPGHILAGLESFGRVTREGWVWIQAALASDGEDERGWLKGRSAMFVFDPKRTNMREQF